MHAPVGYLISTVVLALWTLLAVVPPRPRHSSASNRTFLFSCLPNELPFLGLYWLVASTALALTEGAVRSWLGRGALAVAAASAGMLLLAAWRGFQTRPVVDAALDAALGSGWRATIDPALAAHLRRRPPYARILLAPFAVRRRDVERIANIRYGDAGRSNLLDVYRHRSRPLGCPAFVYFHGGGFHSGRKSKEARALLYRLASQGWLCIGANYRLSPAARFPDHLVDAKKVIAWARTEGREYGADPGVVFVAGSSAGGNLAATAGLTPNEPRFQPGFEHLDTSVTAVVSLYGYYGSYGGSSGDPSSPASYLHRDAPPFFAAHGTNDTMVLVEDARAFVQTLSSASANTVVYAELPGGQHAFDLFESPRFASVIDGIEAFAAQVRSRPGAAGTTTEAQSSFQPSI
ncbi:MAG TPA: alpha/beta hydrolase [Gaiellaceae bacterium]|jgi:acetyl esterase/lipase|nr:alpha/beta hydrolase [Gaiellaceae bacterium]